MYYSEITERMERCAWEHLHKLSQEEYVDHSDLDDMKDWLKVVCMIRGLAEAQYISDLQAKVQGLEAERLANANMVAAFNQSVANDKELRTEMYAFIKPLSEESANNRVTIARLEEQIKCAGEKAELREQVIQGQLREQGLALNGKIDQVASAAKCCCEANSAAIASLQALVGKITQTNVPLSAICPEAMPRYNSWTAPTTTAPTQS